MIVMTQESQFELFAQTKASYTPTGKIRYFKPNVTLSFDNIVLLTIALVVLMVLSFSLGVENGKKVARLSHSENIPSVTSLSVPRSPAKAVTRPHQNRISIPLAHPEPKELKTNRPMPAVVPGGISEEPMEAVETTLSTPQDFYTVQVASFKQEKYARQEAMNLKQKGYEIFIMAKGQHSIVCVGKFAKKNEAMAMSGKLRKYYKDCLVRNL